MAAALVTTIERTETRTRRRIARTEEVRPKSAFLESVVADTPRPALFVHEGNEPLHELEQAPDVDLDGGLVAAVGEMLRMQRGDAAASLSARLRERGVDSTVCAFLEDDLREAADALADAEIFFQETLDALDAPSPSPRVLMERASDANVLERVDHLHNVLSNMRRRLVQVAAGVRHVERKR